HRVQWTLEGHMGAVHYVMFSPDGRLLATASNDGTVRVWDVRTGHPKLVLGTPLQVLGATTVGLMNSPLGPGALLTAAALGPRRDGHTDMVPCLAFSSAGQWLASSSRDKTVKVWDVHQGQEMRTLRGHTGEVRGVTFSPDDRWLVSAS